MKIPQTEDTTREEFVNKMKAYPHTWGFFRSKIRGGSVSATFSGGTTVKTFNYGNKGHIMKDFWNSIRNIKQPIEVVIEYSLKDF